MNQRNVVLIGFMGTGKTTIGRALASRLGWTFVDTDQRIEQLAGMSVSELFAQYGEPAFRERETSVLKDVLLRKDQVVSTGGGAVLNEHNRAAMTDGGLVVALKADLPVLVQRLKADRTRPLLQGDAETRIRELMERRKHAYDFADVHIDTGVATPDMAVETVLRALGRP